MKKRLALILACAMLAVTAASCAPKAPASNPTSGSASTPASTPSVKVTSNTPADTLVVGSSEMNGDFIEGFGNSAYDLAIKTLLHGYASLVSMDDAGAFDINTTYVASHEVTVDEKGNKTYTFKLKDGLVWSDGTPITAADYALNILWSANPEWAVAGGSSSLGDGLLGYAAYSSGESDVFEGVKVLSDTELALTIDAEQLPYFWEIAYLAVSPMNSATYIVSGSIETTDAGSKIALKEGKIADHMKRISETERFAPTVVCGPYKFVSFENQIVTLEINDKFNGDINGKKPTIKYIVQKAIPMTTDVDMVIAGDIDLSPGVIEGKKIEATKASDSATFNSYLRNGYGVFAMHGDWGVTADVNVRWALASLIDRNAVLDYVLEGYGATTDSDYALAQWMYQEKSEELAQKLKPISFNTDAANDYLDKSEYKFESDGTTAFDRTKAVADGSYLRHNSKKEPLVIEHLGTAENTVTDIIEIQYQANAPLAGIKFNVTKSDFNALMDNYYYSYDLGDDRKYNTFNLATGFGNPDDKYWSYHSDQFGTWLNATQTKDEKLDAAIMKMRSLESDKTEDFANAWVEYLVRWNELMPSIPLYANEYFDIYNNAVDNMPTTPFARWYEVICDITKTAK